MKTKNAALVAMIGNALLLISFTWKFIKIVRDETYLKNSSYYISSICSIIAILSLVVFLFIFYKNEK